MLYHSVRFVRYYSLNEAELQYLTKEEDLDCQKKRKQLPFYSSELKENTLGQIY